jgi:predicted nucleic acid-binding protein
MRQRRHDWLPILIGYRLLITLVDETLMLLRARGERKRALLLGAKFFRSEFAVIHKITETQIALAWEAFEEFVDKDWSFTDCTSKVVIEQLGIAQAFAFDHHFKQFGVVQVVP